MDKTQVVVIGAGPGGYAAAFRAADLGLKVVMVDTEVNPGGVCLYKGCIPSKALLHVAKNLNESKKASEWGVSFGKPEIDLLKLRGWKSDVVKKLTSGLGQLAKQRKVMYIQGRALFEQPHCLHIFRADRSEEYLEFEYAIIATGSYPVSITDWPLDSPHLWHSTRALELSVIPKKLLVIGGGYIGLEMGTVYSALGSMVSVVEMLDRILPGIDADLVAPLKKGMSKSFEKIYLKTQVKKIIEEQEALKVLFENNEKSFEETYDSVLVAIGRKPNSSGLGLEAVGIDVDTKGFIRVNDQRQTSIPHIFAIGDVAGEPMLAHKATHEGLVAAQAIAGEKTVFEPQAIPAVVFTDPEIAWCGLTEEEAKKNQKEVKIAKFPWAASGRSLTLGRTDGVTKLILDPETERILGMGITGPGAGELIAEGVLAIEMGATAKDMALTIHPHPTLTETLMEAASVFYGTSVQMYRPQKEK